RLTTQRTMALAVACALLVVSCGGDGSDGASAPAEADAAATTAASGTASEEPSTTDDGQASGPDDTTIDAESTASPHERHTPPRCDAPVPGSEPTFGVYAPATGLDPTMSSGALVGGHELAAVYDVLFRFDFESNEYIPHLA